jgi:hypothetical protein
MTAAETAILDRLRAMARLDRLLIFEIGHCAGDAEDAVVGPCGETEAADGPIGGTSARFQKWVHPPQLLTCDIRLTRGEAQSS